MRIFAKLLISVLAAIFAIFLILAYMSLTQNRKLLTDQIHQRELALLEANASRLSEAMDHIKDGAPISEVSDIVDTLRSTIPGYAFLIGKDGVVLSMPQDKWENDKNVFDIAKALNAPDFASLGKKMVAGDKGFMQLVGPVSRDKAWAFYGPVPKTDWSLAFILPQEEIMGPIRELHYRMAIRVALGLLALALIILIISRRMTRPIGELAKAAEQISEGNFNTSLPRSPSGDEIGTLTRSFAKMQTSLAQTIDNLHQEKELFGIAFSEMNDALVVLDHEWNILQFNHAAEKLFSLPTDEPFMEHLAENFESSVPMTDIRHVSLNSISFRLSRRDEDPRGWLYLDSTATPIYDTSANLIYYVISAHDVTDIEASDRSKRTFLALISHKLFTPITPLQGNISMLKDGLAGELTSVQKKLVDMMFHQTGKLRGVIEKLVNFVTMEEGELDKTRETIELNSFLTELSKESHNWFPEVPTDIKVNVEPTDASMTFNAKYLRLIMGQLLENAIKFNLSDPATVEITCRQDGNDTTFVISDNGVGIPSEYMDKIFEKFFQAEKYFTGNVEGVGLGLTYVKTLVSHFGGTIDVKSESGKGSTFTVTLHSR